MKSKLRILLLAFVIVVLIAIAIVSFFNQGAHMSKEKVELQKISNVPAGCWEELAKKKIFFAHMSVGYNMIEGLEDVIKDHEQISLKIIETDDPASLSGPVFAHAKLGHNTQPLLKIESFNRMMESIAQAEPDIAFLKFCYVDINKNSNPDALFESYAHAIRNLKEKNPRTQFVHLTVPLCSTPLSFKRKVKAIIKVAIRKPGITDDNLKRQQFNELLRKSFTDKEPIFDLATAESTSSDGFTCYTKKAGQKVPTMLTEYTTDGGHLNKKGRRVVAEQLLIKLAKIAKEQ